MHSEASSHLAPQCGICGTILTGAMGVIYRSFGIRRSPRNPNICTRCSTHVEEGKLVEITVLFADLSSFTELLPGDVIATGTPGGVGAARTPAVFLAPGDVVEVEIERVGLLRNDIVTEAV